jgi:hypothetical protein
LTGPWGSCLKHPEFFLSLFLKPLEPWLWSELQGMQCSSHAYVALVEKKYPEHVAIAANYERKDHVGEHEHACLDTPSMKANKHIPKPWPAPFELASFCVRASAPQSLQSRD